MPLSAYDSVILFLLVLLGSLYGETVPLDC